MDTTTVTNAVRLGKAVVHQIVQVVHDTLMVQPPPPIEIQTAHPEPLWSKLVGPALGALLGGLIGALSGFWALRRKQELDDAKASREFRHRLALVAGDIDRTVGAIYEKAKRGSGLVSIETDDLKKSIAELDELVDDLSDIRNPVLFTAVLEWHFLVRHMPDALSRLNAHMQGLRAFEGAQNLDDTRRQSKASLEEAAGKIRGEAARVLAYARQFGVTFDFFENVKTGDLIHLARPGTESPYFRDPEEPWVMRWLRNTFRRRSGKSQPESEAKSSLETDLPDGGTRP